MLKAAKAAALQDLPNVQPDAEWLMPGKITEVMAADVFFFAGTAVGED